MFGQQLYLLFPGMTSGMLLYLHRRQLYCRYTAFRTPLPFGMHDEQGRRRVAAFTQHGHRLLKHFDRCLKNQDRFAGYEPAGIIAYGSGIDTVAGAPQPQGC